MRPQPRGCLNAWSYDAEWGNEWIADHASAAWRIGKPVSLGALGVEDRARRNGGGLPAERSAALIGPALGVQTPQVGVGVVHEAHHLGERAVARSLGDQAMHLLGDPAIRGVALRG